MTSEHDWPFREGNLYRLSSQHWRLSFGLARRVGERGEWDLALCGAKVLEATADNIENDRYVQVQDAADLIKCRGCLARLTYYLLHFS